MIGTFLFFVNLFLWFGIFSLPLLLLCRYISRSIERVRAKLTRSRFIVRDGVYYSREMLS